MGLGFECTDDSHDELHVDKLVRPVYTTTLTLSPSFCVCGGVRPVGDRYPNSPFAAFASGASQAAMQ